MICMKKLRFPSRPRAKVRRQGRPGSARAQPQLMFRLKTYFHWSELETNKTVANQHIENPTMTNKLLFPLWFRMVQWCSLSLSHLDNKTYLINKLNFTCYLLTVCKIHTIDHFPHSLHKDFTLFLPTVHLPIRFSHWFNLLKPHSMPDTNSFYCFCPFCGIIWIYDAWIAMKNTL